MIPGAIRFIRGTRVRERGLDFLESGMTVPEVALAVLGDEITVRGDGICHDVRAVYRNPTITE